MVNIEHDSKDLTTYIDGMEIRIYLHGFSLERQIDGQTNSIHNYFSTMLKSVKKRYFI